MSLFNGPNDPISFQPRGDDGPTFYLRQTLVKDRERIIAAAGTSPSGFWQRLWALKAAIGRMADSGDYEAEFAKWHELIDAYGERVREAGELDRRENSAESREAFNKAYQAPAALDEIFGHVKDADEIFERLINGAESYRIKFGRCAARLFLVGWKGPGLGPFRRDIGGTTEECLQQISTADLVAIGSKLDEMLEPQPAKVGNSVSASSLPSNPTISGPSRSTRQPRRRKAAAAAPHSNGQISAVPPTILPD